MRSYQAPRPGDAPAFWLRLAAAPDAREVELGVLGAVALLLGDRVGLAIDADGVGACRRPHGA